MSRHNRVDQAGHDRYRRLMTAVCIGTLLAGSTFGAGTLTTSSLDAGTPGVSTGTFQTGSIGIADLSHLTGTGYTFDYASQQFTPSVSGSYTFGFSSAPFDAVLILYAGNFDPTAPSVNAVDVNDDSDGAGAGGVVMGSCDGDPTLCPKMTQDLTASTTYYVVVTTFLYVDSITPPVDFYLFGAPVIIGPPPAVFDATVARSNTPAYEAAHVIDRSPRLLTAFAAAGLNDDVALSNAASQTLPLFTGGSQQMAIDIMSSISRLIRSRLTTTTDVRSNDAASDFNRLIRSHLVSTAGLSFGNAAAADRGFWLKPFGSRAAQDGRDAVAGLDADTAGIAVGGDVDVSRDTRLGAAFVYAQADLTGHSTIAPNNAQIDVFQLVGFGKHRLDARTDIDFLAGIGRNRNDGKRRLLFSGDTASADYDSTTAMASMTLSRTYRVDEQTHITPSIGAEYLWIRDEGYAETGAGLFNLDVGSRTTDALILSANNKLVRQLSDTIALDATLGLGYDVLAERARASATFAGAPGASFITQGIDPSPWRLFLGLGLVGVTKTGMEISAGYDAVYRDDYLEQTASLKVRWAF